MRPFSPSDNSLPSNHALERSGTDIREQAAGARTSGVTRFGVIPVLGKLESWRVMMQTEIGRILSSVLCLALAVLLGRDANSADQTSAVSPIPIPSADLKWIDLDPDGAPGVKVATLWGDHRSGAFGAFFRLPAGFSAPLHAHTHEMKLVIVSGTYIQEPEGKPAFRLGPGSYLMQPGGSYRHTTSCDLASECLFFVESGGAFDLQPANANVTATAK